MNQVILHKLRNDTIDKQSHLIYNFTSFFEIEEVVALFLNVII